jgi:hypothetical protein
MKELKHKKKRKEKDKGKIKREWEGGQDPLDYSYG